jgi:8-oxo-dGTP diphosphatase
MIKMDQLLEKQIRDQAKKDGITHLSTGVAVVKDNKILMVKRASSDYLGGNYELPGGGIDEDESLSAGAVREVKEETGLKVSKIITSLKGFDYSTDKKPHVRQINFIVEAELGDITLDPAEHSNYVWMDRANINDYKMSDSMRTCLLEILECLGK